jgi:hypothetical protein
MMTETAKIAGFGKDGQCVDRSDARDLSQELIILAVPQQLVGLRFDSLRCRIKLRASLMTIQNMRMAGASSDNGNPIDTRAVS